MGTAEQEQLTGLLQAWSDGDQKALDKLAPRVHQELHRLAGRCMTAERPNHPLQTTVLRKYSVRFANSPVSKV